MVAVATVLHSSNLDLLHRCPLLSLGSVTRVKSFKLFWMEKVISRLKSELKMRFFLPVYRDIATVTPLDTLLATGAQSPTVGYFMSNITSASTFSSLGLYRPHFNLKNITDFPLDTSYTFNF